MVNKYFKRGPQQENIELVSTHEKLGFDSGNPYRINEDDTRTRPILLLNGISNPGAKNKSIYPPQLSNRAETLG